MSKKLLSGPFRYCFTVASFTRKNPRAKWRALSPQKQLERRAGVGNSCLLPPSALFPVGCDVWHWTSMQVQPLHKYAHRLVRQGKESRLQLPVAPNLPALAGGHMAALERCFCSLAHRLLFLGTAPCPPPLKNDLVSEVECVIEKRRWPELKWRRKKEQMNQFWDVLLMLLPSISPLFFQALCSYFGMSAASHMVKIQLAKMYAYSKEDLPFNL